MEEMYEVLKFIEHGAHCRQSMDCVQGTILLDYMKENPTVEKTVVPSAVCLCGSVPPLQKPAELPVSESLQHPRG